MSYFHLSSTAPHLTVSLAEEGLMAAIVLLILLKKDTFDTHVEVRLTIVWRFIMFIVITTATNGAVLPHRLPSTDAR